MKYILTQQNKGHTAKQPNNLEIIYSLTSGNNTHYDMQATPLLALHTL